MSKKQPPPPTLTIGYLRATQKRQDVKKDKMAILKLAHQYELGQVRFKEDQRLEKIPWKQRKVGDILCRLKKRRCAYRQ